VRRLVLYEGVVGEETEHIRFMSRRAGTGLCEGEALLVEILLQGKDDGPAIPELIVLGRRRCRRVGVRKERQQQQGAEDGERERRGARESPGVHTIKVSCALCSQPRMVVERWG
jgi:hypothetical protein